MRNFWHMVDWRSATSIGIPGCSWSDTQ